MRQNFSSLINWFMDFASIDLDKCDLGQLSKLRTELAQIYMCGYLGRLPAPLDEFPYYRQVIDIERMYFEDENKVRNIQKKIKSIRKTMLDGIEKVENEAEFDWVAYEKSETMSGVEIFQERIHLDYEINLSIITQMEYDRESDGLKVRWPKNWKDIGCFRVLKLPKGDPEQVLLLRFAELLETIPIAAFRRCKLCEKFFFHSSKRERYYCSNLCAAKSGNKERRESIKKEDPARYDKIKRKARQRATASYDRKVKRIHPKAKIQRRKKSSGI